MKIKKSDDYIFGNIPGVSVGDVFDSRPDLAKSGVHKPWQAGIWGREQEGACSIVLSDGYEDDVDQLDYIYYTGHGGNKNGKQVANQEFISGNKALTISCDYNLPVRVTRGYQCEFGPPAGYRYDGLYNVRSYDRVIGIGGFYVCRFNLEMIDDIENFEKSIKNTLPENYSPPERTSRTINKINRDVKKSETIKAIYNFRCQVCNIKLDTPNGAIAIGAHIRALGKPHNGPDDLSNMLCLCPNHHAQFDAFSFYIDSNSLKIIGLGELRIKKINISSKHKINYEFLDYHRSLYKKRNIK
ncbi:MAG: YDG/SRA domain-containing protein [Dehalococcoidia bacterium]